ncbi:MAG: GNAT family N-acetyltransferase [Candidatus Cybelea sp.]
MNFSRPEVRPARPDDAEPIAALMAQLGYDVPAPAVSARLERLGERRDVFVATDGERVVGWAALSIDEAFVEGFGAFLEGLVVDEVARSRGVGRQLLDAVESRARERGCAEIRVQSNVLRERAQSFYERNGYTKVKAQYQLRKALSQ